ncbi:hypothetical protein LOAG_01114 [Loa loa]|uniref:Uncharacterized protein n=1 Tax=Loa loa TaxID=7209 RepID=A0A1S0U9M1_LOALO|nr:hypothetical protein LOAG_01114 [Loa loa]EFO27371.1 hypothetical protein LOAG_01114 [Loa loa]
MAEKTHAGFAVAKAIAENLLWRYWQGMEDDDLPSRPAQHLCPQQHGLNIDDPCQLNGTDAVLS